MVLTLNAQGVEASMPDLASPGHQAIGLVVTNLLDRCCPNTTCKSGQDDQLHKPNSRPLRVLAPVGLKSRRGPKRPGARSARGGVVGSRSVARYGQRSATMKGAVALIFPPKWGLQPIAAIAEMLG